MAKVKLSSFQTTDLPLVSQIQRWPNGQDHCLTHDGTAGVMLDGSDGPLPSPSRHVFSLEAILRVAMMDNIQNGVAGVPMVTEPNNCYCVFYWHNSAVW